MFWMMLVLAQGWGDSGDVDGISYFKKGDAVFFLKGDPSQYRGDAVWAVLESADPMTDEVSLMLANESASFSIVITKNDPITGLVFAKKHAAETQLRIDKGKPFIQEEGSWEGGALLEIAKQMKDGAVLAVRQKSLLGEFNGTASLEPFAVAYRYFNERAAELGLLEVLTNVGDKPELSFRKTFWGMTKQQVWNSETAPIEYQGDSYTEYRDELLGKKVSVYFLFHQGVLVRARYSLQEKFQDKNLYIDFYKRLQSELRKKYGKPTERDDEHWIGGDYFRNRTWEWGTAVAMGYLGYDTSWELPETSIYLFLYGKDHKIKAGVEYTSRKHEEPDEPAKKATDKL